MLHVKTILFFCLLIISGSSLVSWKRVRVDNHLTVMFPDPHLRMDTLYQKIINSSTDSSQLIVSVMPGYSYSTPAAFRHGYDEMTIGYLNSSSNPTVLSKQEQVVKGIISRRINLSLTNAKGKSYMTTVFVFAHGNHYAFQAISSFNEASNRDIDKVLKSARFNP